MSALIKLMAYLIGAVALLLAITPPQKQPVPIDAPREKTAHVIATSSIAAENIAETNTEKIAEKSQTPKRIARPEPITDISKHISAPPSLLPTLPAAQSFTVGQPATGTLATATPPVKRAPQVSFAEINKKTRAALVNIICTTLRSGSFEPLSGSGVIIDPRGVILTNAHVAEYFLLKDYIVENFVECVIRTGEPARNRYKARLLYLSPLWLQANYKKIRLAEPTGTGEHDFAFLLITESVNPDASPLPETYPALQMDAANETLRARNQVLVAGYPAGFLSGINIQKEFYPSSSVVTTGQVFTFQEKTADLFSIKGSLLAQQGSSGGAVVSNTGKLIGLIVTATEGATTGERDLHAITPSHIARSFKQDTGFSLEQLLESDLAASADSFNENVAPALTKLLENALQKK